MALQALVAVSRIQTFLQLPDVKPSDSSVMLGIHEPSDVIPSLVSGNGAISPQCVSACVDAARHCAVMLQDANFEWDAAVSIDHVNYISQWDV